MRYYTPWPYETVEQVLFSSTMNFIPIWVMAMSIWCIVWVVPSPKKISLKIVEAIALTAVAFVAVNFLFTWITGFSVEWGGTAFNATFLLLGIMTQYYVSKYTNSIQQEAQAREEALRYRYEALRAHIDPHFLFNSLNILSSLIVVNPEASQDFIISLSRLYRYVMSKESQEKVTVEDELNFLNNYIDILAIRYGHNLKVDIEVARGVENRLLIPFTLQLLMENVIKHNVISSSNPMLVKVFVEENGITVENPIKLLKTEVSSNVGGKYLSKLYHLHGASFETYRKENCFKAKLTYLS